MRTIIEGTPRPRAVDVAREGGYQTVKIGGPDEGVVTHYRVEAVGHLPCGWEHPTWPDEAEGRLQAHLATCEMRMVEP